MHISASLCTCKRQQEPSLQPLLGERFTYGSANGQDDARSAIMCLRGVRSYHNHPIKKAVLFISLLFLIFNFIIFISHRKKTPSRNNTTFLTTHTRMSGTRILVLTCGKAEWPHGP